VSQVFVLGGVQSDFARNVTREGLSLSSFISEGVHSLFARVPIEPHEITAIHVGNFAAELYVGQAQLGGLVAAAHPALSELPSARHEGACASGSLAVLAAMADLESGRHDVALVFGVELMRNRSGFEAQKLLAAAALVPDETEHARYPWAEQFARITTAYEELYELDTRPYLSELARQNFAQARNNPLAQTRAWRLDAGCFTEDRELNPRVAGKLRKHDCSQVSDGYAALVLVSERFLRERARGRATTQTLARMAGWGHRGAPISLASKLNTPKREDGLVPHVRRTVLDAYRRAGIHARQLDCAEVHDCFSITHFLAIEALDLAAPGGAASVVEDGSVLLGGRCPINPSGGLMGGGHPVGASGVRMLLDASRQVLGQAQDTQVSGARRAATLNIGGSMTTVVSFVVERASD
jgi:acetyl-CoA C-acetyltransferase